MKIVVDRTKCTGLGICESIAPEHFEVDDDGDLVLIEEEVTGATMKAVEEAVANCPTSGLRLIN